MSKQNYATKSNTHSHTQTTLAIKVGFKCKIKKI